MATSGKDPSKEYAVFRGDSGFFGIMDGNGKTVCEPRFDLLEKTGIDGVYVAFRSWRALSPRTKGIYDDVGFVNAKGKPLTLQNVDDGFAVLRVNGFSAISAVVTEPTKVLGLPLGKRKVFKVLVPETVFGTVEFFKEVLTVKDATLRRGRIVKKYDGSATLSNPYGTGAEALVYGKPDGSFAISEWYDEIALLDLVPDDGNHGELRVWELVNAPSRALWAAVRRGNRFGAFRISDMKPLFFDKTSINDVIRDLDIRYRESKRVRDDKAAGTNR